MRKNMNFYINVYNLVRQFPEGVTFSPRRNGRFVKMFVVN